MSRYEKWSLAISAVGFLLVVGTLSVTFLQLKDLGEQNGMTIYGQREGSTLSLDRVFVEYPEIREYFYGNVDIEENNPLYRRVEAVAEMHLDLFDYDLKHAEDFKGYQPFPGVDETWIRDMFRTSPILRKYLEKRKTWYSKKLADLSAESQRAR